MSQIFLTALVTVVAGAVIFVLGQIAVRGALAPALELKRLIGAIGFDLDFSPKKLFTGGEIEQKWRNKFRADAYSLREKVNAIVWYGFFSWLFRLPPAADVFQASARLLRHSSASARQEEAQNSRDAEIKRLLRIRESSVPREQLSGWLRLGLVLSGAWACLSLSLYFAGIWLYPSSLTDSLAHFYIWMDRTPEIERGVHSMPLEPAPDYANLLLLIGIPPLAGWLLLLALPRSIRWVREGFKDKALSKI